MTSSFDWRDMLRFDKMIAPTFLTILYYIVTAGVILGGLKLVFEGMDAPYYGSKMVTGGLAIVVIGPFVVRLNFELLIILFKIHTRLANIDYSLRGQPGLAGPGAAANQQPTPPFGQPGNPALMPYPASYQAYEPVARPQPVPGPVAEPVSPQPIGFQVSPPEPAGSPTAAAGRPLPDFWATSDASSSLAPPSAHPVPPVDLGNLTQKIPNWPAVLASVIALYAVVSPYAALSPDGSAMLGQLTGLTFSIKNGSLGFLVVLATLVMIGSSAAGLKWLWFVIGYGVVVLGSVVAFLEESSLFSQLAKVRTNMAAAGSTLGQFVPGADQFSGRMAQQVPGASQFLSAPFYLFIIAIAFLGYWALGGKYEERGFITGNNS